jgi:hypothetical protein
MVKNTDGILDIEGALYQGSTNVRTLEKVFFSLRNRKFIKPVSRKGDSVSGFHIYKLLPGRYIVFTYDFWNKRNPSISLEISLIRLTPTDGNGNHYNIEKMKTVKFSFNKKSEVVNILTDLTEHEQKLQDVVIDFINSTPGYHVLPSITSLTSKIYDEGIVNELLNFVDRFDGQTLYHQLEVD